MANINEEENTNLACYLDMPEEYDDEKAPNRENPSNTKVGLRAERSATHLRNRSLRAPRKLQSPPSKPAFLYPKEMSHV